MFNSGAMERSRNEIERIRAAYRVRDATALDTASPWLDRAYRILLQDLEWALLEELHHTSIALAGARVLEVGCGAGYFLERFREYGVAHAAGIDLVEDRIAIARARYPALELVAGDASKLPWDDKSFELVTQFTCLSSILDQRVRDSVASEMWRVLAPGGAVISYDIGPEPLPVRAIRRLAALRAGAGAASGRTPTAPVETSELARWFPAAELRCRRVGVHPDLGQVLARAPRVARAAVGSPGLSVHVLAVARKEAAG